MLGDLENILQLIESLFLKAVPIRVKRAIVMYANYTTPECKAKITKCKVKEIQFAHIKQRIKKTAEKNGWVGK